MKSMITKLQNTAAEIPGLQKKIQKEKTCRETNEANAIRNMDSIKEKIENSAKYLEGRLDIVDTLEDRIRMQEAKGQQVIEITLKTKKDIFEQWSKQKMEMLEQS